MEAVPAKQFVKHVSERHSSSRRGFSEDFEVNPPRPTSAQPPGGSRAGWSTRSVTSSPVKTCPVPSCMQPDLLPAATQIAGKEGGVRICVRLTQACMCVSRTSSGAQLTWRCRRRAPNTPTTSTRTDTSTSWPVSAHATVTHAVITLLCGSQSHSACTRCCPAVGGYSCCKSGLAPAVTWWLN